MTRSVTAVTMVTKVPLDIKWRLWCLRDILEKVTWSVEPVTSTAVTRYEYDFSSL